MVIAELLGFSLFVLFLVLVSNCLTSIIDLTYLVYRKVATAVVGRIRRGLNG